MLQQGLSNKASVVCGSTLMALAVVYLVSISAESAGEITQVDNAHNPPKVKNVTYINRGT